MHMRILKARGRKSIPKLPRDSLPPNIASGPAAAIGAQKGSQQLGLQKRARFPAFAGGRVERIYASIIQTAFSKSAATKKSIRQFTC